MYNFSFLTDEQVKLHREEGECWYPVGDILSIPDAGPSMTAVAQRTIASGRGDPRP